mmetsp:Transcript_32265/g.77309  ORF Transcript_32265/g.77309 Transcript_32265/m.77309 type:complete len:317 (+) Transcript_32265:25-975(+)
MGRCALWIAGCVRIRASDFFAGFTEGFGATLPCSADVDCVDLDIDAVEIVSPSVEYVLPVFKMTLEIFIHVVIPNITAAEFLLSTLVELEAALAVLSGIHRDNVGCYSVDHLDQDQVSITCVLTAATVGVLNHAATLAVSAEGADKLSDLFLQNVAVGGKNAPAQVKIRVTARNITLVVLGEDIDAVSDDQASIPGGGVAFIILGLGSGLGGGVLLRRRSQQRYQVFAELDGNGGLNPEDGDRRESHSAVVNSGADVSANSGLQQCLAGFEPPVTPAGAGESPSTSHSASGGTVVRAPVKGDLGEQDFGSMNTGPC